MVDGTQRNRLRVDCVWDIEAADWDKWVCGGLWRADTNAIETYTNEDDFAHALLTLPRGYTAWAHAGGRYDVLWLLDWIRRQGIETKAQISMSGSSIASMRINAVSLAGGAIFRDSCRLVPMALSSACLMFEGSALKERLDIPCKCGKNCGGYCSIAVGMDRPQLQRLLAYLEQDIASTRDMLVSLSGYCDSNDIDVRGTVAGTAWATAQRYLNLPKAEWELIAYKIARAGYYGGRVEVARVIAELVRRYDRNSAYPAALKKPVPCGESRVLDERTGPMAWARDRPGMYKVEIDVPQSIAPPLPYRVGNRLAYPHGRMVGTWPRDEIKRAEECGAKIRKILGGIAWAREEALLKPHVERIWDLRAKAPTKSLNQWLKWLANSLTGAFAQEPERDIIRIGDFADDIAYKPISPHHDWIWRRTVFSISDRAHVHWAATLTADARVELHRQIEHSGDAWCYSDTDSNYATIELTRNVGDELGQWKFEGTGKDWRAIAPKVYSYTEDDGTFYARAKGIPGDVKKKDGPYEISKERWNDIVSGREIRIDKGVKSFLTSVRSADDSRVFIRNDAKRHITEGSYWCGARIRVKDGRTRAPSVKELERLPC